MGNKSAIQSQHKQLLTQWTFIQKVVDARYGEAEIYKSITGEHVCLIQRSTSSDVVRPAQANLKHPNLVCIQLYEVIKQKDLCNNIIQINIVYEYLTNDLQRNIQFRKKQGARFSESQIWLILKSCLQAMVALKTCNIDHQNMTPDNILISQKGQIKIFDSHLLGKSTSYMQVLMGIREDLYLSPEQLEGIKLRKPNIRYDKERSDIFSLGLCILHAVILENLDDICDKKTLNIQFYQLRLVLENINQLLGYSPTIRDVLLIMLQEKPAKRPTSKQLLDLIEQKNISIADTIQTFEPQYMMNKQQSIQPTISTDRNEIDTVTNKQSPRNVSYNPLGLQRSLKVPELQLENINKDLHQQQSQRDNDLLLTLLGGQQSPKEKPSPYTPYSQQTYYNSQSQNSTTSHQILEGTQRSSKQQDQSTIHRKQRFESYQPQFTQTKDSLQVNSPTEQKSQHSNPFFTYTEHFNQHIDQHNARAKIDNNSLYTLIEKSRKSLDTSHTLKTPYSHTNQNSFRDQRHLNMSSIYSPLVDHCSNDFIPVTAVYESHTPTQNPNKYPSSPKKSQTAREKPQNYLAQYPTTYPNYLQPTFNQRYNTNLEQSYKRDNEQVQNYFKHIQNYSDLYRYSSPFR